MEQIGNIENPEPIWQSSVLASTAVFLLWSAAQERKLVSMTMLLLVLLVGIAVAAGVVLVDSGLRMWSALGGMRPETGSLAGARAMTSRRMPASPVRVTTRVSYAAPPRLRAAA
jgi:hypothetical protein